MKCLICSSPQINANNDGLQKGTRGTVSVSETLADQIRVIFVLRKLLRIPQSICETYLKENGNPSTWVSICSRCSLLVEEALFVQRQINKLQKRLETLGLTARNEIRQSRRSRNRLSRPGNECLDVTHETQDFIFKQDIENVEVQESDEESDSFDYEPTSEQEEFHINVIANSQQNDHLLLPSLTPLLEGLEPEVTGFDSDDNYAIKVEVNSDNDEDYRPSDGDAGSSDAEAVFPSITQVTSQAASVLMTSSEKADDLQHDQATTTTTDAEGTLQYECHVCNRKYRNELSLKAHRRRIHSIYVEREPLILEPQNDEGKLPNPILEPEKQSETDMPSNPDHLKIYKRNIRYRKFRRHCEVCNKEFPTLKELFNHRKAVHNLAPMGEKPPYADKCEICGKRFTAYVTLQAHRLKKHGIRQRVYIPMKKTNESPWKCTACPETFALDTDRNEHESTVHDIDITDLPFECNKCKNRYRIKSELVLHCDLTHKPKRRPEDLLNVVRKYVCNKCPMTFKSEDKLDKHIARVHLGDAVPYKCTVCGRGCTAPGHLRKHMQIHTGNREFVCEVCGKRFTCSTLVTYHKLREHDNDEDKPNPLRCEHCKKIFSTKSYLRLHKATVHEKKFKHFCEICGSGFQGLSNLKVHLLTHDKTKKPKKYCTKKRREKEKLRREEEMASINSSQHPSMESMNPLLNTPNEDNDGNEINNLGEASSSKKTVIYRCKICPKMNSRKYTDEEDLKRHILKCHEGDKNPFKCLVCGKGCHSPGALKLHSQVHSGERLFPCDLCDQTFTSPTYVTYHKNREHLEEGAVNPLQCEICLKVLASKTSLRMHKSTIHEKKFKAFCVVCGMGFGNQSILRNHMKKHNKSKKASNRKPYSFTKKRVYDIQASSVLDESGSLENPVSVLPVPAQPESTVPLPEPGERFTPVIEVHSEFLAMKSGIDFSTQFF